MKVSLWTLAFVCLFSISSIAQKSYIKGKQYSGSPTMLGGPKALATDTLGYDNFLESTATIYDSPGSGFASGNNQYGDKVKAQVFVIDSSFVLQEVLLWFGAKDANSGDGNSKVKVKLHNRDGLGAASGGEVDNAPGSGIDSADVLVSDIDVAEFASVDFNNRILFGDFAVSVDFSTLSSGDTLGLYTTEDEYAGTTEQSWEKWSDDTWHTMLVAWDLDIDFAIWPVIDASTSGINDSRFFEGIKMSQNTPNPASGETTIEFGLEKYTQKLHLEVYDVSGKKVQDIKHQDLGPGEHKATINTHELSAGTYYYSIKTDTGRITKKMMVVK